MTNILSIALLGILALCSGCIKNTMPHPDKLTYPPLIYNPPLPERIELSNGMTVFLLPDHHLPRIEVTALIRTGSAYDPADRAGLAVVTGTLLRTGGTKTISPETFDAQIDACGAHIDVAVNAEDTVATLWTLSEDFNTIFPLFAAMLMEPAFDSAKLSLAKNNLSQSLRQIPDAPQQFASREFKKILYANNPRGNLPTIASVQRITHSDIKNFHSLYFNPCNIYLGISGDFSKENILATLHNTFSVWRKSSLRIPALPTPLSPRETELYQVQKDLPQTTIIAGHLAPAKSDADYCAFQILDYIIGSGGFSSRLMSQIRTARGLAYSVGSFYRASIDYGVFAMYCSTKSSSTYEALELLRSVISTIANNPPTEEEITQAKDALINNFIFSCESPQQILMQHMMIAFDNLPSDFYSTMPQRLQAVTQNDIQRVAHKWLKPDAMTILILGNAHKFDTPPPSLSNIPVQFISSDILSE